MGYGKFKFVIWVESEKIKSTYEEIMTKLNTFRVKYDCSYFVMGKEVCPTSGRPHVDGYYEYKTARKETTEINKFKKLFGEGWGRVVTAHGSAGENFNYSTKEDRGYEEHGIAVVNGESRNLTSAKQELVEGKTTTDSICLEDPEMYHMYGRTLSKIEDICMRKKFRTEMTTCIWYHGKTGVGKSHKAFEGFTPDTHYVWKGNDNGWQDGYQQQETVIINDFRGEIKYNEMLQLIDKWPHTLPRRGREPMPFMSKHIIITSSLPPDQVYCRRLEEDSLEQLLRRIDVVEL